MIEQAGARLAQQPGRPHVKAISLEGQVQRGEVEILGMIPDCNLKRVSSVGNSAGDGARIALLNKAQRAEAARVARWVEHIDQPLEEEFQKFFIDALAFPHSTHPFPHIEQFIPDRQVK